MILQTLNATAQLHILHALATIVTAIGMLVLSSIVLLRERGSRVSTAFFLATLTLGTWLLSFANMYMAQSEAAALPWAKIAYLGIALIPAALYDFTTVVLRTHDRYHRRVQLIWLVSLGFAGLIIGTDFVFDDLYRYPWGYFPRYRNSLVSITYFIFFGAVLGISLYAYWSAYRKARSGVHRQRVKALMIAFSLSLLASVDYAAAYGVAVYPFGYAVAFVSFLIIVFTIQRYQLVDITPSFAADSIIATMADPLIVCDEERIVRVVNDAACAILGYAESEFLGQPVEQLIYNGADATVLRDQHRVLDEEIRLRTKAGRPIIVSVSISHLRNRNGRVAGTVIIARDIRARKRAEQRMQHQLQRLTALRDVEIAINASLDLRATLNAVVDQVTNQLQRDAAAILLFNSYAQTLEFVAGRGFRTQVMQNGHLRLGEGLAGRAALERRTISIPMLMDARHDLARAQLFEREEFAAYYGVPLTAKGEVRGVLEVFHRTPMRQDPEWLNFLETLAGHATIAIDNAQLFDKLQRSNVELKQAYNTTLEGWARALELRDMETEGHSRRVTEMTVRLAREMGMSDEDLVHVRRGALLHDIGKMGISDNVLLRSDPLAEEEVELMKQHPVYAYELLAPIEHLRPALDIPYCHHEKWDGTGYPRGLAGNKIPLAARVFAVVDVYDALTSDRPYREAWSEEEALAYIREHAGTHFDPEVVEVFVDIIGGDGQGAKNATTTIVGSSD